MNNESKNLPHKIPIDFRKVLSSSKKMKEAWEDITPLARNEFICWIISAKKIETRKKRIKRAEEDLRSGKRRPCCWMGCVHREDKKMSSSQKFILGKES